MAIENKIGTRKAALILAFFILVESPFVLPALVLHPVATLSRLGLAPGHHTASLWGWIGAALVALLYVRYSCTLPSVRENLVRFSGLKVLALLLALVAGILEEFVFRGVLMDWLRSLGWGGAVQILASALTFGLAHGIWGLFRGSWRAALGAISATGLLGGLLAVVYLIGDRSLGPCIASHFLINAFAEPGLVLAAVRGEMDRRNYSAVDRPSPTISG